MELFGGTKDYIRSRYFAILESLFPSKIANASEIPIIINNFNRKTFLLQLIESLEKRGYTNIYILDNASSYPPLLEYYKTTPYEVIHLGANLGFKALWKNKLTKKRFCNDYYIYTDSDVMLEAKCPSDIIDKMFSLLRTDYRYAFKIGPSIRIDNIPDCYALKKEVVSWESAYYTTAVDNDLYRAPIDTTFALYRPRIGLSRRPSLEAYRMAPPYQIEHLPWYVDSQNLSDEDKYYASHCNQFSTWCAPSDVTSN